MCNERARTSFLGSTAALKGQHCGRVSRRHNCISSCCSSFGPGGGQACAVATALCKHPTDSSEQLNSNHHARLYCSSHSRRCRPATSSWHQTIRLLLVLQLLLSALLLNSEASRQLISIGAPHSTGSLQDLQQQQQQHAQVEVQGDRQHSSRHGRTLSIAWFLQAGRDATGSSGSSSSNTAGSTPSTGTVQTQQQQQPPQQDSDAASIAAMLEQMQRPQVMISDLQLPADSPPAAPTAGSSTATSSPAPGSTVSPATPASGTTSTALQATDGPVPSTVSGSNASVPPPSPSTSPAVGTSTASTLTLPIFPGRRLAQSSSSGSGSGSGRQLQQAPMQGTYGGALCSATINYGASVGDASKRGTAEVPIFVGSFDVAVTSQQQQKPNANSSWVLGWQFTAGEHIQQLRDVFGDDGIYNVHLLPDAATVAAGGVPQGIAVLSNSSLTGQQSQVTFSFVGRKGPPGLAPDAAPFRVAPPSHLFLNNHFCWPLLRPSPAAITAADGSSSNSSSAHVGMRGETALIEERSREVPVYGQNGDTAVGNGEEGVGVDGLLQPQQQWAAVAVPQLPTEAMPRALMVEYLPVEFTEAEGPGLFAKNLTQFYVKVSNRQPSANSDPVFLDQILLQYWFHGPNEPVTSSSESVGSNSSSEGDAVVALVAGQFRMACSDATAGIGCDGIAWNITAGLPQVYGARFVLNIWFPANTSTSSYGNITRRILLLPNDTTVTNASHSVVKQQGADGSTVEIQAIPQLEAILMLDYRRFFASINARDDYSYLETAVAPNSNRTNSSSSSSKPIVRRIREPNPRLPAFVNSRLAWGSPPVAAERPGNATVGGSTPSNAAGPIYPPGSYCQRTADGGLVCGVDMLYCCFGGGPLSSTPPADWEQWLQPPDSTGSTAISGNPSGPSPSNLTPQQIGVAAGGDASNPPSGQQQQMQPYVIALIAVVPIIVLVSAALLYGVTYWAKREIRRNASAGSGGGEASSNGQVLLVEDVAGSGGSDQQDSLLSNNSRLDGAGRTLLRALLSPKGRRAAGMTDSCYVGDVAAELGGKAAGVYSNQGGKLWMFCCQGSSADGQTVLHRTSPQPLLLTAAVVNGRNDTAMEPGAATAAVVASGGTSSFQQQQQQAAEAHAISLATAARAATAAAGVATDHGRLSSSGLRHEQQGAAVQDDDFHLQQQLDGLVDAHGNPITSDVLTPEQLAFVYLQQSPNLLWHVRAARGRTLPESMLNRAVAQVQHLDLQQLGEQQQQRPSESCHMPVGRRISSGVAASMRMSGSFNRSGCRISSPTHAEGRVKRHATWNGRLSDDAFGEDPMEHLLNLQLDRQLNHNAAINAPGSLGLSLDDAADPVTAADGVIPYLPTGPAFAGAGAAAVEAAVAAINAAIASSAWQRQQQQQQLASGPAAPLKPPGSSLHPVNSLLPSPPSFSGNPAPSFYKALMETGGVIKPPGGGAPIPLNVDFAAEIQPHLGRLLGKGGFGAVYEATWRGKKVAVKLLTVDTEEPAVLDAFLKEVALCACLRGCSRVVRLLGACLGGVGGTAAAPAAAAVSAAGSSKAATAAAAVSSSADAAAAAAAGSHMSTTAGSSAVQEGSSAAAAAAAVPRHAYNNTSDAVDIAVPVNGQESAAVDVAAATDAGGGVASKMSAVSDGQQQHGQQQQQLALIMELVEGGNLAQRIYNPSKRRLTYLEVLQVALDVTNGLAYLHPAVVHRDLKPQNVLLDKQGRAKIADFGISRFKDPTRSYLSVTHQGGTPNYMAPELFNGTRVDEAADVYSLGCILYECVTRRQPFSHLAADAKSFNVLFKIIVAVAINKERPPLPHDTPPRLAALIERCWLEDPAHRPRVAQLTTELQDMMQEELHARAEKLGRLRRLSSRTHSLPSQSSLKLPGSIAGSSTGAPGGDSDAAAASASGSSGNSSGGSSRRNSAEMSLPAEPEAVPANVLLKSKSEGAAAYASYLPTNLQAPVAAAAAGDGLVASAAAAPVSAAFAPQYRTTSSSSNSSSWSPMVVAAAAPLGCGDAAMSTGGPSNSFTEPLSFLTSSNTSFRTAASIEFVVPAARAPTSCTAAHTAGGFVAGAAPTSAPTSPIKPSMLPPKLLGLVPLRWRCPQEQQQQHSDHQRLLLDSISAATGLSSSSDLSAAASAGPATPGRVATVMTSTAAAAANKVLGWQRLQAQEQQQQHLQPQRQNLQQQPDPQHLQQQIAPEVQQQQPLQGASSLLVPPVGGGVKVSGRLSSGQPGTPSGHLSRYAAGLPRQLSDASSVASLALPVVSSGQAGAFPGSPSGQPGALPGPPSGQPGALPGLPSGQPGALPGPLVAPSGQPGALPGLPSGQPGDLPGLTSGQPGNLTGTVSGNSTDPPPSRLTVSYAASSSGQVPRRSTGSVLDRSVSNTSNASAVSDGGACADTSSVASSSLYVSVKAGGRRTSSSASCSSALSSYQAPGAAQHKLQNQQAAAVLEGTASSNIAVAAINGNVAEPAVYATASDWQETAAMASALVDVASDDDDDADGVLSRPAMRQVALPVVADVSRHSGSSSGSSAAMTGRGSSSGSSGGIQRKVNFALP